MNDLAPISIAIAPFCERTAVHRQCTNCGADFTGHQFAAWCPTCIESATLAEHRQEVALEQRRARASFPPWVSFAQFENPTFKQATKRAPGIVAACQWWKPSEGNLLLVGPTGVGKTASAVALFFRLADRALAIDATHEERQLATGAYFITAPDLAAAYRAHPLGRGKAPCVLRATRATLTIIDDLGNEAHCPELFFAILDARQRLRMGRPTIVTTALDRDGLRDRYGDAFVRRLVDPGRIVSIQGEP